MAQNLSEPLVTNSGPTPSETKSSTSFYSKDKKFLILFGFLVLGGILFFFVSWLLSRVLDVNEVASFHHEHPANIFTISEDNTILVTVTESGSIHAWNIQAKSNLSKYVYPGKVTGIDISYDNQYIVASGDDKAVRVFSLKTHSQVAEFLHPAQVTQFQIPQEELNVVTICGDNKLRIWSIESGKLENSLESLGGVITSFDYKSDLDQVVFGTTSGSVEIYTNTYFGYSRTYSYEFKKPIIQVNPSNDLVLVSVRFEDNSFAALDTERYAFKVRAEYELKINDSILKFVKGSTRFVLFGDKIELHDIFNKKKIAEFKHGNRVTSVATTSYEFHVISASDDNMIRVWEIESGKEATSIKNPGKVKDIVVSQDQSYFAAGGDDGYVRVYTLYI